MQDMLQSDGKNFTVTRTRSVHCRHQHAESRTRLCSTRCARRPSDHAEARARGPFKNGTFAAAYNVSTPPDKLVTSGAWRSAQHVTNEKTVLVRNPYYYGFDQNKQRLPYLDELVILVVPDQDAADLKFRAGGVDALDNVKPENYRWYEENQAEGQLHAVMTLGRVAGHASHVVQPEQGAAARCAARSPSHGKRVGEPFVDPVKYAWFNNRDFRRAVSMAIDRDAHHQGHRSSATARRTGRR